MMTSVRDILRLVRAPQLALIALALYIMETWIAVPLMQDSLIDDALPVWVMILLMGCVICIAGGAYVVNDYFDIKIDQLNRPDSVIVGQSVSKDAAMHLFYALTAAGVAMGIAVCIWAHSFTAATIVIMVPGLMWFYSAGYKRQFLLGNIIAAFTLALIPLLSAIVHVDHLHHCYEGMLAYSPVCSTLYSWFVGYAVYAFLCTIAMSMTKNLMNLHGEREMECHTLAVVKGINVTRLVITFVIALLIGLIIIAWRYLLPFSCEWNSLSTRFLLFGIVVPLLCYLWLLWAAKEPIEYKRTAGVMQFVLSMSVLYGFVIMRIL